jgi:large subunit ribosomal protein L9
MRVILTQNVPKLGQVGDVCDVAPGYGRNYLLPQRMAILSTKGGLRQVVDFKRTESRRQDKVRAEMNDFAGRIARTRLVFTAKVGDTGRLFGSITAADIAEALAERLGEPIDRRKIILDESIRTLGEHVVPLHLMPGVDAHITVQVDAEEPEHPPAVAEVAADVAAEAEPESIAEPDSESPEPEPGAPSED